MDGRAEPSGRTWRRETIEVALVGVASLVLYGGVDAAEHALSRNGALATPGLVDPGFPTDRVAAANQLGVYIVATLALFAGYAWILARARRGALEQGLPRAVALLVPVAFHVALAFRTPRLSQDVLSYIAHGALGVVPGSNPLLQPASDASATALGPGLGAFGWGGLVGVTPYGIVWTRIEIAVVRATSDVPTAVLALKAVALLASLASAAAIWVFAGKVAPRWRVTATLAYLWSPLFVVELAGEGHNDAVMLAAVLWGLAAVVSQRPGLGGLSLLLGVFAKYVPLLFAPPQLVWAYRSRRSTGAFVTGVALGVVAGLTVAAVLYAPLWAGADSFSGILHRADPISSASPFGALNWILRRSPLRARAGSLSLLLTTVPVIAFVLWRSAKVKDAAELARVCGWSAAVYLLGAAPDYWPWYSVLPAALLVAACDSEALVVAVVLALCARMIAPLNVMFVNGLLTMKVAKGLTTGIGATLPLLVCGIRALRSRTRPEQTDAVDLAPQRPPVGTNP